MRGNAAGRGTNSRISAALSGGALEGGIRMTDETEPVIPEAPDAPDDNPSEPADDPVPETDPEEEPRP
jgi:hypothetical protein